MKCQLNKNTVSLADIRWMYAEVSEISMFEWFGFVQRNEYSGNDPVTSKSTVIQTEATPSPIAFCVGRVLCVLCGFIVSPTALRNMIPTQKRACILPYVSYTGKCPRGHSFSTEWEVFIRIRIHTYTCIRGKIFRCFPEPRINFRKEIIGHFIVRFRLEVDTQEKILPQFWKSPVVSKIS